MNFKGFKKVGEDEHKAHFENKNGHVITIAKKGLSQKHIKQLKELPLHASSGAVIQSPEEEQEDPVSIAPPIEDAPPEPQAVAPEQVQMEPMAPTVPEQPSAMEQPEMAAPQQQSPQQQTAPPRPATPGDYLVDQMQKVSADLATNQIDKKTYSDLMWKNDDGSEKSVLGKMGTLFGLLVSGAGAGLTKQPSTVMTMMDNEIKTDLERQKANRENKLNYFNFLKGAIEGQAKASRDYADVAHLATQDAVTMDALVLAMGRREALDELYKRQVAIYPEGSPQRMKAESIFGMMLQGANAADQSAGAFVNGRWNLFKNQPGMIGGPSSFGGGQQGAAQGKPGSSQHAANDPGINYKKWDELTKARDMKLPGAPSESELEAIRKESTDVLEARQIRKTFIDSFNELDKMFLAGALSPNQRAAYVNALGAKMATLTSHRYNANEAAAQADGMFPSGDDWSRTREVKHREGLKAIDALESGTPTLNKYSLKTPPPYPPLERKEKGSKKQSTVPKDGTRGFVAKNGKKVPTVVKGGKWVYE